MWTIEKKGLAFSFSYTLSASIAMLVCGTTVYFIIQYTKIPNDHTHWSVYVCSLIFIRFCVFRGKNYKDDPTDLSSIWKLVFWLVAKLVSHLSLLVCYPISHTQCCVLLVPAISYIRRCIRFNFVRMQAFIFSNNVHQLFFFSLLSYIEIHLVWAKGEGKTNGHTHTHMADLLDETVWTF